MEGPAEVLCPLCGQRVEVLPGRVLDDHDTGAEPCKAGGDELDAWT